VRKSGSHAARLYSWINPPSRSRRSTWSGRGELTRRSVGCCVLVGGRRLLLSAKEFELLAKLAEHPTRVYEKDELLREVWGIPLHRHQS
jgi:DNA-binding response OmpR family regulator